MSINLNSQNTSNSGAYESPLNYKVKILRSVMLIAMIFSFLFGLLHDLGINDIGRIHSAVDYVYSLVSGLLLIALWKNILSFKNIAVIFWLHACVRLFPLCCSF